MQQPAALKPILSMLACPVCHGSFAEQDKALLCLQCGRSYSIVDGIPVLIAERAKPTESNSL